MSATASPPHVNKWLVALSVTFGTLMVTIDASIVNVATPHLRGAMSATRERRRNGDARRWNAHFCASGRPPPARCYRMEVPHQCLGAAAV